MELRCIVYSRAAWFSIPSRVNLPGHDESAALTKIVALGTDALGHMYFLAKSSALSHENVREVGKSTQEIVN